MEKGRVKNDPMTLMERAQQALNRRVTESMLKATLKTSPIRDVMEAELIRLLKIGHHTGQLDQKEYRTGMATGIAFAWSWSWARERPEEALALMLSAVQLIDILAARIEAGEL